MTGEEQVIAHAEDIGDGKEQPEGLCHGNGRYSMPARAGRASCGCDSTLPVCGSFSSEYPQCRSGDEMALKIEVIVDGGMHAQEALGGSS